MYKEDEVVMAVERSVLFKNVAFQGFNENFQYFEERVLRNKKFMQRKDLEKNPNYKQPIAVSVIINQSTKKVFSHQRLKGDKRLQKQYSLGIMEHINPKDNYSSPIDSCIIRALEEEVNIHDPQIKKFGVVNDDTQKVSKCHIGFVYIVKTDLENINLKDPGLANGKFSTLEEIMKLNSNGSKLESWSVYYLPALFKLINS